MISIHEVRFEAGTREMLGRRRMGVYYILHLCPHGHKEQCGCRGCTVQIWILHRQGQSITPWPQTQSRAVLPGLRKAQEPSTGPSLTALCPGNPCFSRAAPHGKWCHRCGCRQGQVLGCQCYQPGTESPKAALTMVPSPAHEGIALSYG